MPKENQTKELTETEKLTAMVLELQSQLATLTRNQPARPAKPAKLTLSTWTKKDCNSLKINDLPATEAAATKAGYKKAA